MSVPLGLLGTISTVVLLRAAGLESALTTDEGSPLFGGITFLLLTGGIATIVPLVLVTMAVAVALGDLERERAPRLDLDRLRSVLWPVVVAVGLALLVQVVLVLTVVGSVVALVVLVFTSLAIPACVLERLGGRAALRRSVRLVRGRALRVFAVTLIANGLALVAGPVVGLALLFLDSSTIAAIDIVSSLVYVAVLPYAAVVQTLLFFDVRARAAGQADTVALEPEPAGGRPAS